VITPEEFGRRARLSVEALQPAVGDHSRRRRPARAAGRARPSIARRGRGPPSRRRGRSRARQEYIYGRMHQLPRTERARDGQRREPDSVSADAPRPLRQRHRTVSQERTPDASGCGEQQPDRRPNHRSVALYLAADQRHAAGIGGLRGQEHPHGRCPCG
jgi:hypothetical protein